MRFTGVTGAAEVGEVGLSLLDHEAGACKGAVGVVLMVAGAVGEPATTAVLGDFRSSLSPSPPIQVTVPGGSEGGRLSVSCRPKGLDIEEWLLDD